MTLKPGNNKKRARMLKTKRLLAFVEFIKLEEAVTAQKALHVIQTLVCSKKILSRGFFQFRSD